MSLPSCRVARRDRASAELLEPRRLLSGQLDPSFGLGGVAGSELFSNSASYAVAIQGNGKIVAVGGSADNKGFGIARFNSSGQLDRSFGTGGRTTTLFGTIYGQADAVAMQRDGKIVVAGMLQGSTASGDTTRSFMVARYLSNGRLDGTFGAAGKAAIPIPGGADAVVIGADGKIWVGGWADTSQSSIDSSFAIARLTSTGHLDNTFGTGGMVTTLIDNSMFGGISDLFLQSDGGVVAAGQVTSPTEDAYFTLARYNAHGALDSGFRNGGIEEDKVNALSSFYSVAFARQADGKIVAAGEGPDFSSLEMARFNAIGTVDSTFHLSGTNTIRGRIYGGANAVLIQKNGEVLVASTLENGTDSGHPGGSPLTFSFLLARVNSTGQIDSTFGHSGSVHTPLAGGASAPFSAALQSDGKIVVAGQSFVDDDTRSDAALVRYSSSGKLDPTFGFHGVVQQPNGFTGDMAAMATQADGKILVAGSELSPDPSIPTNAALARYNADGTLDTSFGSDGRVFVPVGSNSAFTSVAIDGNGRIVAGGYAVVGTMLEFLIERFLPSGAPDPSFGVGGQSLTIVGDHFGHRCNAIVVEGDNSVIAVGSTSVGMAIVHYLSNGTLDPAFGTGGVSFLRPGGFGSHAFAVALQKDGKVLVAGTIAGQMGVVRLRANGALDTSFGVAGIAATSYPEEVGVDIAQARAMTIDPSGNIVLAGSFNGIHTLIARFLPNGKPDLTFGVAGQIDTAVTQYGLDIISSVATQPNGKILVGGANIATSFSFVARFGNGGLDTTFGQNGIKQLDVATDLFPPPNLPPIDALLVEATGKILAAGFDLYRLTG